MSKTYKILMIVFIIVLVVLSIVTQNVESGSGFSLPSMS